MTEMDNFFLPKKLTGLTFAITIGLICGLIFEIYSSYHQFEKIIDDEIPIIKLTGIIVRINNELSNSAHLLLLTKNKKYRREVFSKKNLLKELLSDLNDIIQKDEKSKVKNILILRRELEQLEEKIFKLIDSGDFKSAQELFNVWYKSEQNWFRINFSQITEEILLTYDKESTNIKKKQLILFFSLMFILMALIFSWTFLARSFHHNVEERNKLEDILRIQKVKAEEGSNAKSDFLARMSHEIRTPLNGIVGCVELLSSENLDEKQKDLVSMITYSAERLKNTITDILDFSKIENRELAIHESEVDIREIISNLTDMFKKSKLDNQNEFIINIDKEMPSFIITDENFIFRILMNLYSNSNKFTNNGKISVEIKVESKTSEDLIVWFQVIDNGKGIDSEYLKVIFDPFSQEDDTLTRKFEGTGLGMPIVKELINIMGGAIEIESEVGKGTKTTFTIHAKESANKNIISDQLTSDNKKIKLAKLIPLKILVVDDDFISLKMVCKVFRTGSLFARYGREWKGSLG